MEATRIMQNICEYLREESINKILGLETMKKCWPIWQPEINKRIVPLNASNIINLGDKLQEIFRTTGQQGRSQSDVSSGGTAWESLVCWYLNLCLIGSRTVVFKQQKALLPEPNKQAITVWYGNFPSNTESDLIAITFPDKSDYLIDKFSILIENDQGISINTNQKKKFNYKEIVDALVAQDFPLYQVGIIQCKTNWNDNAQIPMLWDMIYSSTGFKRDVIKVGSSEYSINSLKKFTYSFVTVPTSSSFGEHIKSNATAVNRVHNLSGGNYWGLPTKASISKSIKEILGDQFSSGSTGGIKYTLTNALPDMDTKYSYLSINNNLNENV